MNEQSGVSFIKLMSMRYEEQEDYSNNYAQPFAYDRPGMGYAVGI